MHELRSRTSRRRILPALIVVALVAAVTASCSSSKDLTAATFHVGGSVGEVSVTDAQPGTLLTLRDDAGDALQRHRADSHGSLVFRHVAPGGHYRVTDHDSRSTAVTVLSDRPAPASTELYDQKLPTGYDAHGKKLKDGGYGYVTVRDGTKLAVNVHPGGPESGGPYPTVVEYSGYAYAKPGSGESSVAPVWNVLGYTVVDVNMRGTGCSGGAFDFFDRNQILDGYDVIETVARQPWALHHKVGMVGVSYGGFSQLFVAQTNPPHLAAITPDSVLAGVMTTLYPGGMLNNGFALSWAAGRDHDAEPATAKTGQPWAYKRIKAGDTTCKANQKLHSQAVNLVDEIHRVKTSVPSIVDPLTLANFVGKIDVPTVLNCQFTDEETGGYCPFLADDFTSAEVFHATFTNGTHIDSIDPVQLQRSFDLLELYVADRVPDQTTLKNFAPAIYATEMKVPGVKMPDDPVADASSVAEAKATFAALPKIQVLFENGHGTDSPGAPLARFSAGFSSLSDHVKATPFYFGPHGTLGRSKPTSASSVSFEWDPEARPRTSIASDKVGAVWSAEPPYDWKPLVQGKAVAFVTDPLPEDVVTFGGGSVDTWLRSTAPDTDLQVTVSEVRPDGKEIFVQNGWLRASYRKLDPKRSSPLQPVLSARRSDIAPLPTGKWTEVHIPLYTQGHVYRKGSRLRVSIEAPGGDQPSWAFDLLHPKHEVTDSFAISPDMPSRLLLGVVGGFDVPDPLPAECKGMRGEPCRAYAPFTNTPGTAPNR